MFIFTCLNAIVTCRPARCYAKTSSSRLQYASCRYCLLACLLFCPGSHARPENCTVAAGLVVRGTIFIFMFVIFLFYYHNNYQRSHHLLVRSLFHSFHCVAGIIGTKRKVVPRHGEFTNTSE